MDKVEIFVDHQRVFWDQLDLLGVLHNGEYPVLFERARTAFWRSLGIDGYHDSRMDFPYYVVRNEVDYKLPITSEQIISVSVFIAKLGTTSLTFGHHILDESGELASVGQTTIVRVDAETRKPIPWSEAFRNLVLPFVIDNR